MSAPHRRLLIIVWLHNLFAAKDFRLGWIVPDRAHVNLGRSFRDQIILQAPLLIHVSFDDAGSETTGQLAVLTGFKQNADHDVWIAARGKSNEPRVVFHGV